MTVAIRKRVRKRNPNPNAPGANTTDVTMPVIAYSDPGLAELVVTAWADKAFNGGV